MVTPRTSRPVFTDRCPKCGGDIRFSTSENDVAVFMCIGLETDALPCGWIVSISEWSEVTGRAIPLSATG